jgi:predicted ester cyclase
VYKKKAQLNIDLYRSHIEALNEWENAWHTIHNAIHDSVNQEMEKKYMVMYNNELNKFWTNTRAHQTTTRPFTPE